MSYTIELSQNRKYFRVIATGQITLELALQWSRDLQEKSRALGIQRFLFDVRSAPNACSVFENFMFANKDAEELKLERNVRSAILVNPEDRSHNFVQLTMKNAGYNVMIFMDEPAALQWLEEPEL